jgi:hypothetical protein
LNIRSIRIPLFALAVFACGDVLSAQFAQLVGRWRPSTQSLQPRGTMDGLFVVSADGATENHVITRGVYSDQSPGDLSGRSVLYGQIVVRGDKFIITPDSLVTHDLFYGPTHRHVQREFTGWPRDSTRYAIEGDQLVLEYYTYPADAPVLTRRVLSRVN